MTSAGAPAISLAGLLAGGAIAGGACLDWSNPLGYPSDAGVAPLCAIGGPPGDCLDCERAHCCAQVANCSASTGATCMALAECWQGLHPCPSFYDYGSEAVQTCLRENCAAACPGAQP